MLWMERLALVIYVVANIFLFGFTYLICHVMNETPSLDELKNAFIFCVILTIPFWLLFRAFDYLCGGPLRRQIRRTEQLIQRGNSAVLIEH